MKSINPSNGTLIKEYQELSTKQVNQHIEEVQEAWISWRETTFEERSKLMLALALELRKNQEEYATIISLEMGKPIIESMGEVEKSAWVCEYYAKEAEQMLKDEILESDAKESFVSFEPMGVVLAVMPWNFPFWQVFRFAAPALMAGNVGLLKHASNVMGCAEAIESCFVKSGFPENTFKNLVIGSSKVEAIIKNPHIKATTLTGSEYAGSKVAGTSGSELKKSVFRTGRI